MCGELMFESPSPLLNLGTSLTCFSWISHAGCGLPKNTWGGQCQASPKKWPVVNNHNRIQPNRRAIREVRKATRVVNIPAGCWLLKHEKTTMFTSTRRRLVGWIWWAMAIHNRRTSKVLLVNATSMQPATRFSRHWDPNHLGAKTNPVQCWISDSAPVFWSWMWARGTTATRSQGLTMSRS